jgi:4-carboxymuconolactone decarboxylase
MSRIPYPDLTDLSPAKREAVRGWGDQMLNISHMLMHCADGIWLGQRALARSTVLEATIELRLRELLILRVAYLSDCEYELFHHLSLARQLGATGAEIDAMRTGDFSAIGEKEGALGRFVTEIVVDVNPDDETMAAIRAHFSDAHVIEMIMIIGYYMMVARAAAAAGIEVEKEAVTDWAWLSPAGRGEE